MAFDEKKWRLAPEYDAAYWGVVSVPHRSSGVLGRFYGLFLKPLRFMQAVVKHVRPPKKPYSNSNEITSQILEILEPQFLKYGIHPASRNTKGTSVIWCTATSDLTFKDVEGYDKEFYDSPEECADIWVKTIPNKKIISLTYTTDLFDFIAETDKWSEQKPEPIELAASLADSLEMLLPDVEKFMSKYNHRV